MAENLQRAEQEKSLEKIDAKVLISQTVQLLKSLSSFAADNSTAELHIKRSRRVIIESVLFIATGSSFVSIGHLRNQIQDDEIFNEFLSLATDSFYYIKDSGLYPN